jgi:hypothetical protein
MKTAAGPAGYRRHVLALAIVLSLLAVLSLSAPAQAAPALALSPASGAVGSTVAITGTVFDSYKGDSIHIFFDTAEISGSPVTVPESGTFNTTFTVPSGTSVGAHHIRAKSGDITTPTLAEGFFTVVAPAILLDIESGTVGARVTITGNGFYAGRVVGLAYYHINAVSLGTEIASSSGRFTYEFSVPESTGGFHRLTASNDVGSYAEALFDVVPSIKLNTVSGAPGELLNIRGTGFGYRGTIRVNFGTFNVATATTNDFGSFQIDLNIPDVEPGSYSITVQDGNGYQDQAQFTLTAGTRVSPTTGPVGATLTVHGGGFRPGGVITVDFDGQRAGSGTADANGAFNIALSVPPAPAGPHIIDVTDGTITRQVTFTIESDAPPAPVPLAPALLSPVSIPWNMTMPFDWQDVEDPSRPVVYSFEIANDEGFTSLVLQKTGLTESSYTLTADQTLKAGSQPVTFYWRARATDAAGNVGAWSEAEPFSVSAPAAPSPLVPAEGSTVLGPVRLAWQPVDSPTPPVIYGLQVAADDSFRSALLDKSSLATPEYVPDKAELKLREDTVYYWRVRATDGVGNVGDWSPAASFTSGSSFHFPAWAIYALIGLVAVIGIVLAYVLGRRTVTRPPE